MGDALWTARVTASKAVLAGLRGSDPATLAQDAANMCRECGIAEDSITSALREW